ncbi:PIN domain-containing protein [Patescibacteria group bacterium]|nr:PIN domain-containing protein [Patescibacteria group bacterium]
MNSNCFIDTNVWVYLLQEDADQHPAVATQFRLFAQNKTQLYLSPDVLEEFLFIFSKLNRLKGRENIYNALKEGVNRIRKIPTLEYVSLPTKVDIAYTVIDLMEKYLLSSTDAYILLTVLQNRIPSLMTFDKQLQKAAKATGKIEVIEL